MVDNRELALVLKLVADQFNAELKKQQSALGSFGSFIKDWRVQLAGAGTILFGIAKSTANYGDELLKTSQKVGVNIKALAGLQFAAKLADVEHAQLAKGLKFLSQNMTDAARGVGDGEAVFRRLGVTALTTAGQMRPTEDVLLDVAAAFAAAEDDAGKTEAAVKLFGKAGLELIPFLNQGKDGIKALMAEAGRLGLVMSEQDAKAAEKFNDELKTLEAGVKGMTIAIGKELIPVMNEFLGVLKEMGVGEGAKAAGIFIRGLVFAFKDFFISVATVNAQIIVLASNILDIFSEEKAKELGARMDRIAKMAEEMKVKAAEGIVPIEIVKPFPPASEQPAKKKKISQGPAKADIEQFKAQFAAKEQAIKNELELSKLGFARQQILADNAEQAGQSSLVRAAEDRARIKQQELESAAGYVQRQLILEDQGHKEQLAKFGGTATERQKIEADHQKRVADLTQQGLVLAQQITNAKLEGEAQVQEAQNQTAKQQLDLLFAGAAAIKADRETRQSEAIALAQARLNYDVQIGASTAQRYAHETDLLVANLAKQTDLTLEESRELLQHWARHEDQLAELILTRTSMTQEAKKAIELQSLTALGEANERASDDVFAGWAKGMKRYVDDTKSGFGLGADIARRMVQTMESFFARFFDDFLNGKIKSFKDVMRSLLDFVKLMVGQIIAQLAAMAAAKAIATAALAFANTGGTVPAGTQLAGGGSDFGGPSVFAKTGGGIPMIPRHFLRGGPVLGTGNRDTVPAMLTPGEIVLSRGDVHEIKRMEDRATRPTETPITVTSPDVNVIVNNYAKADVKTSAGMGANGARQLYITIRDATRQAIASGDVDGAMSGRFKLSPKAGG
jgi:hypothetical protein